VVVAAFPFLILRYSTKETSGWFGHVLHGGWFWPVFGVWLAIVFIFTYLGVDLGLQSTSSEIRRTGARLTTSQNSMNTTLGTLRKTYQEGIDQLDGLETRVQKGRIEIGTSLSQYSREVDTLLNGIRAKDSTLDARIDRVTSKLTDSAGAVTNNARAYGLVVKLGAELATIQQVIAEILSARFPCGVSWENLADSRTLVYFVKNDERRTILPFYLQKHVWWAVMKSGPPVEEVVMEQLNVERCVRKGEGSLWTISDDDIRDLPTTLQNVDTTGVTLPCPVAGPVAGVIVIARPSDDHMLFQTDGRRSRCFGTATDVMANVADAITPYIVNVRDEL